MTPAPDRPTPESHAPAATGRSAARSVGAPARVQTATAFPRGSTVTSGSDAATPAAETSTGCDHAPVPAALRAERTCGPAGESQTATAFPASSTPTRAVVPAPREMSAGPLQPPPAGRNDPCTPPPGTDHTATAFPVGSSATCGCVPGAMSVAGCQTPVDAGRADACTTPPPRTHTATASPAPLTARIGAPTAVSPARERVTGAPHEPETNGRTSACAIMPPPRSIVHAAIAFPVSSSPTSCPPIGPAPDRSIGACHCRDVPGRHAACSTRGAPMSWRHTTTASPLPLTATRGPGPTPGRISSAGASQPLAGRERASSTCTHAGLSGADAQTGPSSRSQTTTASPLRLIARSGSTASGGADSATRACHFGPAAAAPHATSSTTTTPRRRLTPRPLAARSVAPRA